MKRPAKRLEEAVALHQQGRIEDAARGYEAVLAGLPSSFDALRLLGMIRAQQGAIDAALGLFMRAAKVRPDVAFIQANVGTALAELGRHAEAIPWFDRAIALDPRQADGYYGRGNALVAVGRAREAVASFDRAIALDPRDLEARLNRAKALLDADDPGAARAACENLLGLRPDDVRAMVNLGAALIDLERPEEALPVLDRALALDPRLVPAHHNRANALAALEHDDEALAAYDRALALDPGYLDALVGRGSVVFRRGDVEAALDLYDAAIARDPGHVDALHNRGTALIRLNRMEEALASIRRSIERKPDAVALTNAGFALVGAERHGEALECFGRALELRPGYARAARHSGVALNALRRYDEAARAFARALAIDPDYEYAKGEMAHARLMCCDWTDQARLAADIERGVLAGKAEDIPFSFLSVSSDAAAQLLCARTMAEESAKAAGRSAPIAHTRAHGRIRVASISPDFGEHPVTYLITELIERHDRDRFEVIGVSLRPWDRNPIGERIISAFDRAIDVTRMSDRETVGMLRELEVDVAVDIAGYTSRSRPMIYPLRAAPVQVNWLGFPGTLGSDHIDYMIADRVVIPESERVHYAERIAYLPDCFLPRDTTRTLLPAPTRASAGLPEAAFVFCSFNNAYKLNPGTFDIWMRLLERVPGSVLWLSPQNEIAVRNLRIEAVRRGVAAERLVFAKRTDRVEDHVARYALADLFLDTSPYNAHTTASDALWAGLPLLTRLGTTFAGRVAASLLHAIGLPELVTTSVEAYESLALELATDPARLGSLRAKLAANRTCMPLFDSRRFRRHLEAAYVEMVERARRGQTPESFAVSVLQ